MTELQKRLLDWYDKSDRSLPWRGEKDPYKIWISEIMLQQTRAEAVKGYYERFLARFPKVSILADAQIDEVYKLWEGLGYYSRARNLHKAAMEIMEHYDGKLPNTAAELKKLSGIGSYTSGAIASIAFGERVPAPDGNQVRVLARIFAIREPIKSPEDLYPLALAQMPEERCGDYNQALMDLGATVCLPKIPRCHECPVCEYCHAHREGLEKTLPIKAEKARKKEECRGVALVFFKGRVLVRRRPAKGLLAGLYEFPGFENAHSASDMEACLAEIGIDALCKGKIGAHDHIFTHKIWKMTGFWFEARKAPEHLEWAGKDKLGELCFPSAMRPFLEFAEKRLDE